MNGPWQRLLVLSVLVFSAWSSCALAHPPLSITRIAERIEWASFHSQVLGVKKRFCVVLPAGQRHEHRPRRVLFLLHGRGRTERSLVEDAQCRRILLSARFVTVLPDGDDGWYIDSPVRKQDQYATYLEEVIAVATDHYQLSRHRAARGLSGWSMGGYGCVRFAETHADEFGAVAPMIGLLDFPRLGLPEGQSYPVPIERFGRDAQRWRQFNPMTHAERLRNTSILITTADRAFDRRMNENFAHRLKKLGIPCEWRMLKGQHTFGTVRRALPIVVDFMERTLSRKPHQPRQP